MERKMKKITLVMPVLNEEIVLNETLSSLHLTDREELIVIDGGSADNTVSVAQKFTDRIYITKRGRGHQMNFGAGKADGDILLFLHADCILPTEAFGMIRNVLKDKRISAGAFDLSIVHPQLRFRIIEYGANLRSRVTCIPYGDQGLFMKREVFDQLGGFPDIPLMEDIEISKGLKRIGKIVFVRPPIKTSPRRWLKEGPVFTTLRDWAIAVSFAFFKVSPYRLTKYYEDVR
jgi:rSAM/selenodomain-associated transferase 2